MNPLRLKAVSKFGFQLMIMVHFVSKLYIQKPENVNGTRKMNDYYDGFKYFKSLTSTVLLINLGLHVSNRILG